jgi:tetraacyldisaccharide 4'-kinase
VSQSKPHFILFPFSWIYGIIVWFRNLFFNIELIPSENFDMPVLSVGNITVGGTGKTPHTEYLIRILSKDYQIAVLSRGYKRKSKGFLIADAQSSLADIGDEPLQMKRKFSNLVVAVDENRRRGIHELMDKTTKPFIDVILLDDAFQHRYVNPSISILLIDYNRMLQDDFLLPVGNLREPAGQMKRADIVIISKCPENLKPIEIRILTMKIKLQTHQTLYYTTMKYGELKAMHPSIAPTGKKIPHEENFEEIKNTDTGRISNELTMDQIRKEQISVLVLTGIAAPNSLIEYVRGYSPNVQTMIYPDHHEFGKKEAKKISQAFEKIKSSGGVIISTEKDVMRIQNNPYMELLTPYIYYPDLLVHFLEEKGASFEQKILDYVRINKRHRELAKK